MPDKVISNNNKKKQAIWVGKQCSPVQNEIFKRIWSCFIIPISKINALKILFSLKLSS